MSNLNVNDKRAILHRAVVADLIEQGWDEQEDGTYIKGAYITDPWSLVNAFGDGPATDQLIAMQLMSEALTKVKEQMDAVRPSE